MLRDSNPWWIYEEYFAPVLISSAEVLSSCAQRRFKLFILDEMFSLLYSAVFVHRSAELPRAWEQDAADLAPWGGVGSEEPCERNLPGPNPHREQESCRYCTFSKTFFYCKINLMRDIWTFSCGMFTKILLEKKKSSFVLQIRFGWRRRVAAAKAAAFHEDKYCNTWTDTVNSTFTLFSTIDLYRKLAVKQFIFANKSVHQIIN